MDVDVHHIVEWADVRAHEYSNLIALCPNCHRRAHKDEIDRKSLYIYKANLRLLHDRYSNIEIDTLFELGKIKVGSWHRWPDMMLVLLGRIRESGLIEVQPAARGTALIGGVEMSPALIRLTVRGREFLAELSAHEL